MIELMFHYDDTPCIRTKKISDDYPKEKFNRKNKLSNIFLMTRPNTLIPADT